MPVKSESCLCKFFSFYKSEKLQRERRERERELCGGTRTQISIKNDIFFKIWEVISPKNNFLGLKNQNLRYGCKIESTISYNCTRFCGLSELEAVGPMPIPKSDNNIETTSSYIMVNF